MRVAVKQLSKKSMGVLGVLIAISTFLQFLLPSTAHAATTLSAEIVSWQIVGLDSNSPATEEPELFHVQAKITNTGAEPATNATTTIALSSPSCGAVDCITLVSPATLSLGTIGPGVTVDAFWTVRVAKTSAAFGTVTSVVVTAQADNAPTVTATQQSRAPAPCGTTDTPGGVLVVEDLISQARNDVISYTVSPGVQRPDGSWDVSLGSLFTVEVVAQTATSYEEISVPAIVDPTGTILPISASFTYELGTPSDDDIYTLNAGGIVNASYVFRADSVGDVILAQLIYDCSGNSFHYNSDYLIDVITIHVVGTPDLTIAKSVSPSGTADVGDVLDFTVSYSNPGSGPATNVRVTDAIPSGLDVISVNDGGTYDSETRTITWVVGTVEPGASGSLSYRARVGDFAGGTTLRNLATATADGIPPRTSQVEIPVRETIPVTGQRSELLLVFGLALIGAGLPLQSRRLELGSIRSNSG